MSNKASAQLVKLLHFNQPESDPACKIILRTAARILKKAQEGAFESGGKVFRLNCPKEPDWEAFLKRWDVRDQSVCPGARVMFDYVVGEKYATAIIEAWA